MNDVAAATQATYSPVKPMLCDLQMLSDLLQQQWRKITLAELQMTGFVKRKIARLIEQKYGINHVLTENYLSNIERTLPLAA